MESGDPTYPVAIAAALTARGLAGDALVARTREPDVKAALVRATEDAAARGVFGVPTFISGDELFWGSDRATDVERYLAGNDPVDRELAAAVIARPLGTVRPK